MPRMRNKFIDQPSMESNQSGPTDFASTIDGDRSAGP
jgi:hypothetical protein